MRLFFSAWRQESIDVVLREKSHLIPSLEANHARHILHEYDRSHSGPKEEGIRSEFEFLDQAFRDVDSEKTFTADELTIVEHHRFEGASDPEDMSVVYAIESQDGTRGIIADAFGVYANPDLGGFLNNVILREEL